MIQRFRVNTPIVAVQEIEGEAILINFDSGSYYSANAAGAHLLDQLQRGASPGAMAAFLSRQWDLSEAVAGESVDAFLRQAGDEGLIVPDDSIGAAQPVEALKSPASPAASSGFVAPRLEKFEDLQDLLMLDPIHDVDQVGWPLPAPGPPGVQPPPVR